MWQELDFQEAYCHDYLPVSLTGKETLLFLLERG